MKTLHSPTRLVYPRHASVWTEALPLGNGRLAAMVYGRVVRERVQLNEESLWEGERVDRCNPKALEALPEIRRLIFSGKAAEAEKRIETALVSPKRHLNPYQSMGEVLIDFVGAGASPSHEASLFEAGPVQSEWGRILGVQDYQRALDIETGLATTAFCYRGVKQQREYFCSSVDQLIVIRSVYDPGCGDVMIHLQREQDVVARRVDESGRLVMEGELTYGGMRFCVMAEIRHEGGVCVPQSTAARLEGTTAVEIRLALATSYAGVGRQAEADPVMRCQTVLEAAADKSWSTLKSRHTEEHRTLFNRCRLWLPAALPDEEPTVNRLAALRGGADDPGLTALHFQFGRYLLMGSSRPGSLPANLQGKWCHEMQPAWNSDYHANINLQMNYWPGGTTGLAECNTALFDWMETLVEPGREAARKLYGCRGWTLHHASDIHGCVEPMDGTPGVWPMGAAWLCLHLMEHWRFTGDTVWLSERGWPLLRGAAEFVLDYLIEAPEESACPGQLVTCPSYSPENRYIQADGTIACFTYGATMDLQLSRALFEDCLEAMAITGVADEAFATRIRESITRLAPVRISEKTGRILEWAEDYQEAEPGHRHMSHLFGLHPVAQITDKTPDLFNAARAVIDHRLKHGGGHTGWSKAWLINFYARLKDGDAAYAHLRLLLAEKTLPNLFDDHPPFQIDGNFGACAGVAEMLLQSHAGDIELLPALPQAWPEGKVCGLRTRGGFEVDLTWAEGGLTRARIVSHQGGVLRLRYGSAQLEVELGAGKTLEVNGSLHPQPD